MKHYKFDSTLRHGPTIYYIAQSTIWVLALVWVISAVLIYGLSIPHWSKPKVRHSLVAPFTETCWPVYGMESGYCMQRERT